MPPPLSSKRHAPETNELPNGWLGQSSSSSEPSVHMQHNFISNTLTSGHMMNLNQPSTGVPTEELVMHEDVRDLELRTYLELLQILKPDACCDLTWVRDLLSLQDEASQFWQRLFKNPALVQELTSLPWPTPMPQHVYDAAWHGPCLTDVQCNYQLSPSNGDVYAANRQWAPQGTLGQQLDAIRHSHHGAESWRWQIPQKVYTGARTHHLPAEGTLPFMEVNVAASTAIVPQELAQALAEPLKPGFPEDVGASPSRESRKFTIRFAFRVVGVDGGELLLQNENPKQKHEYASKNQSSAAVKITQTLSGGPPHKDGKAVPLMRAVLVEMVMLELQTFMQELQEKSIPLTFRGRIVNFTHLQIVNIYRPTRATVQPTLEILADYRYLYCGDTGAPV